MKKNIYKEIFIWFLAVLPLIIVFLVYNKLPEKIPMHWDISGVVSYSPKNNIWIVSALGVLMMVFFEIIPRIDPRRKNYSKFTEVYDGFRIIMVLFILAMVLLVISESLNPGKIRVSTAVSVGLGILFVFLGNVLPKIKNNYFFGIKTPWTLSSTNVWNKTHRLGGILMFISGIVMIPSAFILPDFALFVVVMSTVLVSTILPSIMSFFWFKQEENNKK